MDNYELLENRIKILENRMDKQEDKTDKMSRLEYCVETLSNTVESFSNRIDKFNEQIASIQTQEQIRENKRLENENTKQYEWIKYIICTVAGIAISYLTFKLGIK